MNGHELARAWKDPERSDADHPAGEIVLSHTGGTSSEYVATYGCCGGFTAATCTCTWDAYCWTVSTACLSIPVDACETHVSCPYPYPTTCGGA